MSIPAIYGASLSFYELVEKIYRICADTYNRSIDALETAEQIIEDTSSVNYNAETEMLIMTGWEGR